MMQWCICAPAKLPDHSFLPGDRNLQAHLFQAAFPEQGSKQISAGSKYRWSGKGGCSLTREQSQQQQQHSLAIEKMKKGLLGKGINYSFDNLVYSFASLCRNYYTLPNSYNRSIANHCRQHGALPHATQPISNTVDVPCFKAIIIPILFQQVMLIT